MVDTATASGTASSSNKRTPADSTGRTDSGGRPGVPVHTVRGTVVHSTSSPTVDVEWLGRYLLGNWAEARLEARRGTARPELQRIEGRTVAEHRQTVFTQLKLLVEEGAVNKAFPTRLGGQDDHGGNIAGFEELV